MVIVKNTALEDEKLLSNQWIEQKLFKLASNGYWHKVWILKQSDLIFTSGLYERWSWFWKNNSTGIASFNKSLTMKCATTGLCEISSYRVQNWINGDLAPFCGVRENNLYKPFDRRETRITSIAKICLVQLKNVHIR